ncbi:MAG: WD40 repeat domain-containing protein, partial [Anaerolineae bacterium]|nr:WD40 repeat domain-containing protein [Anaerolineae bacterium]
MRYVTLFLWFMLVLVLPVAAQEGYPLPDDLQPMTVENAAQIKLLASVGGLLPGSLSLSHDGKRLIVNTSAGLQLYDLTQPQQSPIKLANVSYAYFGKNDQIVANGHDIDEHTGEQVESTAVPASSIPDSTNNTKVKVRTKNGEVIIDVKKASGKTVSLHMNSSDSFNEIVFSPDEQYAVLVMTYTIDDYILSRMSFWNMESGKHITDLDNLDMLKDVSFRGDGKLIVATAYYDGGAADTVAIWDGHTGERIGPMGSAEGVVYFSPDNKLMMIFIGRHIEMWTDHLLGSLEYLGYSGEEGGPPFAFSPDGKTFVKTGVKQLELWDVPVDSIPDAPRLVIPTADTIERLYYSPDGSLLISVEWKKIEVWDARTGAKLSLFTSAIESSSSAPIFSADGHFARATIDDNIQIWNVKQAKLIGTLPNRANFSADGLRAAYWEGGTVHVLDIRSNQQTDLKVIENYLGSVLGFNPTQRLAIFSGQDFAALYDLRTGQEVLRKTVDETFKNAVFNADASYFVTRSNLSTTDRSNYRATINLWHTDDFQDPISQADASYRGRDLLLSPDGKLLSGLEGACGDGGGGAHFMWNTQTGVESLNYYGGTCGPNSQIFSPDSKWLLVGWDGELDMLDVNTILKETVSDKNQTADEDHSRRFLDYHEARRNFRNIAISADGTQVAFME